MAMATIKQRKAVKALSENLRSDRPKPVGEILRGAGYSQSVSESPSLVLQTQGFQEVLRRAGITEDKLAKVLSEGLDATKAVVMGKDSDDSFVDVQPDFTVRHRYLETALKVKGLQQLEFAPPVEINTGDTYNTYIQQTAINPNAPDSKVIIDSTLEMLMEMTKRGQGTA